MDAVGQTIASQIRPGDVLLLHGDLGAGKTTLSKSIIHSLTGVDPMLIDSPTFTYVNEYSPNIFHFDLYRLTSEETFYEKGFDEYFSENTICIVEWPERCMRVFPPRSTHIYIEYKNTGRTIRVEAA